MENLTFFVILMILMLAGYWVHLFSGSRSVNSAENFTCTNSTILDLTPYARCETLSKSKYMIKDVKTNLWLLYGQEEGFNKFLPGRFGSQLLMSTDPNYVPLRLLNNPNDYLLASLDGKQIRAVSNPYSKYYILEVCNYNNCNILGYLDISNIMKYLQIDSNGNISSTSDPEQGSCVQLVFN